MSAAVAQRQSASPVMTKRAPSAGSNRGEVKSEAQNAVSPRNSETPSTYLVLDKDNFLSAEHNPFEQSFAGRPSASGTGVDTPKPALPSVLEMVTPGGTSFENYPFADSLRHGPLSPNLLAGPQVSFDPATFRTGLTPNESNIRTGLTPGNTPGFPLLPTPGTAALLGPYTPNTAAALQSMQTSTFSVPQFNGPPPPQRPSDPFGENQAANGLVFLAQTSQQQAQQNIPTQNPSTREELVKRAASNNSKINAYQDPSALMNTTKKQEESAKNTRSKRSKVEEAPPTKESGSNKKSKSKAQESDDDKRKNFLERNRQAALKCRQRKKQWLSSLQQKVDWYTRENEMLSSELGSLREQVTALKTILAAHKDCAVAHQNGATPEAIAQAIGQPGVFPIHGYR